MTRQQMADNAVRIACWLLFGALVLAALRGDAWAPFDRELANDAAQVQRHIDATR